MGKKESKKEKERGDRESNPELFGTKS